MEVKEAIEFVKSKMYILLSYEHKEKDDGDMIKIKKITDEWDKVISLLRQVEKYKEIMINLENALLPEQWKVVEIIIKKYFPKE